MCSPCVIVDEFFGRLKPRIFSRPYWPADPRRSVCPWCQYKLHFIDYAHSFICDRLADPLTLVEIMKMWKCSNGKSRRARIYSSTPNSLRTHISQHFIEAFVTRLASSFLLFISVPRDLNLEFYFISSYSVMLVTAISKYKKCRLQVRYMYNELTTDRIKDDNKQLKSHGSQDRRAHDISVLVVLT